MTVIVMVHVEDSAEMMTVTETGMKVVVIIDHLVLNLPEVMKEAAGDLQDHLSVMTAHPLLEMTVHQCVVEMIEDLHEEMTDLQQETEAVHGGHGAQMTHHHETTNLKRNPLRKAGKLLKDVNIQSTSTILTIL